MMDAGVDITGAMDRHASRDESVRGDVSASTHQALFATGSILLETAAASSCGRLHATNEDWHSTLGGPTPLFVVADGVSSGAMPSCASREVVARIHETVERTRIDADAIRNAVLRADREVGRSIASQTDAAGAATVALCAGTDPALSRWLVAWVGDCRVYRVGAQAGPAELLTVDDTYRHLHERPPAGGSPDDPARMVGNGAVDAPNVRDIALGSDEMLLLCSDGVHRHVGAHDIGRLLRERSSLAARCVRLVDFARTSGSSDDATVLAVHRSENPRARSVRLLPLGALIALVGGVLLWIAATDWVTVRMLPPASAAAISTVQP